MNAKTVIAAVAAAVSVTITLAACGDSTSGAAPGTAQDATATTVASSIVAPRDPTGDPTTTTVPSTTDVAADTTTTTVPSTCATHRPRRRTRSGARRRTPRTL